MEKKSILTYSPSDVVDVSWAIFPHYLSSCLIVACRPSHPSVIVASFCAVVVSTLST